MAHVRHLFVYLCGLTLALAGVSSAMQTIKLSSGYDMPVVGLGTWQIKPEDVDKAVTAALENGYRHIDTAFIYQNEDAIGRSLKKWFDKGNKREDLFITTKLPPFGNRASDVEKFLKLSLESLGLQYVDMYLIHVPVGFFTAKDSNRPAMTEDGKLSLDYSTDHVAIWKEMEKQVKAGRARSIGLSNFNESQILNVLKNSEIKPNNLQIELQAYNQQKQLRQFCANNNITVTSFGTLGSPGTTGPIKNEDREKALPKLLENPVVKQIAENHKKSTAQVLLKHAVQNGLIVIPKSTNPERIKANIDIFDFQLTESEMKQLNDLDMGEEGRLFDFRIFEGIDKHPEYPFPAKSSN